MLLLANTGFLFTDLPFPQRLAAAAAAGFDGIECHDELQGQDTGLIAAELARLGLVMGGLNLRMGPGMGVAALPGHEGRFAVDVAAAHLAATQVGAGAIHVLAGRGDTDEATYRANLRRACDLTDRLLLIEPICAQAVPDYHLSRVEHALELAQMLGPRVRVMFDWFHAATELGAAPAAAMLRRHRELIAHVQAASIPDRNEPPAELLQDLAGVGFDRIGMEYRPSRPPADYLRGLAGGRGVNPS